MVHKKKISIEKKNPSLKEVLGSKDKDLENAFVNDMFVKMGYSTLQVNIEAYNRQITSKLDEKIRKVIRKNEPKLLQKFGGNYVEINTFGIVD
jgi:hypothetical protein